MRSWLLAALVAAALFVAPIPAWAVEEFYSRDLYPWLQTCLTTVSNLVPLAVIDVMIAGVAGIALVRLVLLGRVAYQQGTVRAAAELAKRVVRACAMAVILFVATWGCNYRRQPLEAGMSDMDREGPTAATLESAILDANTLASGLRPRVSAAPLTFSEVADVLHEPMNAALRQVNRGPLMRAGRPKISFILTPFFTWAGVNGMVNPWALESIVHPDLLPFERPFVVAHEWAHLAGQGDEAEASAVGWLACMKGTPATAYSASLYLIMEATAALPASSRQREFAALDPGVRADIYAIYRRGEREDPRVREAAARTYDQYLRANRVEDGNASYGRALTLILSPSIRAALHAFRAR